MRKNFLESILDEIDNQEVKRAEDMPTEQDALSRISEGVQRLKELGWNDAIYCPKDGTVFNVIEAGSSGIHKAHYDGKWPDGTWWIHDNGDLWPSRPILFKLINEQAEHWSDCAINNEPAYTPGECDCGVSTTKEIKEQE